MSARGRTMGSAASVLALAAGLSLASAAARAQSTALDGWLECEAKAAVFGPMMARWQAESGTADEGAREAVGRLQEWLSLAAAYVATDGVPAVGDPRLVALRPQVVTARQAASAHAVRLEETLGLDAAFVALSQEVRACEAALKAFGGALSATDESEAQGDGSGADGR